MLLGSSGGWRDERCYVTDDVTEDVTDDLTDDVTDDVAEDVIDDVTDSRCSVARSVAWFSLLRLHSPTHPLIDSSDEVTHVCTYDACKHVRMIHVDTYVWCV